MKKQRVPNHELTHKNVTIRPVLFLTLFALLLLSSLACEAHPIENVETELENPRRPGSLGRIGNSGDVEGSGLSGGIVLAGGSTDQDAAMRWFLERTKGGDVVILRSTGTNAYNAYLYGLTAVNSVETFLVNSRELAENDTLANLIRKAEGVFFAGGNQANYVNYWKGTKLNAALRYLIDEKKIPVGGTSAGCAILGEYVFDAKKDGITSAEALANPFDERISLTTDTFLGLSLLKNVVTDQHYSQRDRHGRHVVFMARMVAQTQKSVFGIGVDERTAVCVDENGIATVFGENEALFLESTNQLPETIESAKPLTWSRGGTAVKFYKIKGSAQGNGAFDLNNRTTGSHSGGEIGFYAVENGVLIRRN